MYIVQKNTWNATFECEIKPQFQSRLLFLRFRWSTDQSWSFTEMKFTSPSPKSKWLSNTSDGNKFDVIWIIHTLDTWTLLFTPTCWTEIVPKIGKTDNFDRPCADFAHYISSCPKFPTRQFLIGIHRIMFVKELKAFHLQQHQSAVYASFKGGEFNTHIIRNPNCLQFVTSLSQTYASMTLWTLRNVQIESSAEIGIMPQ